MNESSSFGARLKRRRKALDRPFETLTHRGQVRRLRQLAAKALTAYAIDEPRLTPLIHEDNTTFRVDSAAGERYVLCIHRHSRKTPAEVRSEMTWLAALRRETDLVAPVPLPTRDSDLVTVARVAEVPEPRICVLLRWVSGRFLDAELTPAHLERVGAFMARLQISGAQFRPPDGFARSPDDDLGDRDAQPSGLSR